MSAETRYFRVGLFVLLGILLITAFTVILGGQGLLREEVVFETYFDESVQGLEVGSPVKLRGVRLGAVSEIMMVEEWYGFDTLEERLTYGQKVLVHMKLVQRSGRNQDLKEAIDRGLRLRLTSSPLTGIAYVEADFLDPNENPPMEVTWAPTHLYVPSAPSAFKAFSTAAERILDRIEGIKVEQVLLNLDALLVTLRGTVDEVDAGEVQDEVVSLLDEVRGTNARLQRMIDAGKYDLDLALENLRIASENLRDLSETARSYPSLMILGDPPPPSDKVAK